MLLEKGIMVIKKSVYSEVGFYKYYESNSDNIKIDKIGDELYVNYDPYRKSGIKMRLPFYQDLILICIEKNTPYKVIEYSDGVYKERIPKFEDHIVSNFVKEEIIRGIEKIYQM